MDIVKNAVIKQTWSKGRQAPASRTVGGPDGLLAKLVPFNSQGAMWARRYDGTRSVERLGNYPDDFSSFMERIYTPDGDEFVTVGPLYVVYSYNTPIAWVIGRGEVKVPDHRYSVTTTHHQNMCRSWMGTAECGHGDGKMSECAVWVSIGGEWV